MSVLLLSQARRETVPRKEQAADALCCMEALWMVISNPARQTQPRKERQVARRLEIHAETDAAKSKKAATQFERRSTGDWFLDLFGFRESTYEDTQNRIRVYKLAEAVDAAGPLWGLEAPDGQRYQVGKFWTPRLADLEVAAANKGGLGALPGKLRVRNVVGDVSFKHWERSNRYATFQAASQFNCLEFVNPYVAPEDGVTRYSFDMTQGPACSIACGPATVFRNYFMPLDDQIGQRRSNMLNNLRDLNIRIGNEAGKYFEVQGGYTMADDKGLDAMNAMLSSMGKEELDDLQTLLRIGVQEDAQVTSCNWGSRPQTDPEHTVTQVFGSACSVSYSGNSRNKWAPFASLVLEASYKATLYAAFLAALRQKGERGSRRVYLTALGGGVFGNDMKWIAGAMQAAFERFSNVDLEVYIVTYESEINHQLLELEQTFTGCE